jgi:hypothetical protein
VAAGGGQLQGPAGLGLPPDLGEVDRRATRHGLRRRGRGLSPPRPSQEPDNLSERRGSDHLEAFDEGGLGRVAPRDHDALHPGPRSGGGHRQHPGGGHQLALQGQLPGQRVALQALPPDLAGCREDRHGDGEVEAGAVLPQVGGAHVHRDPAKRPFETAVLHCRTHTLASILDRCPRQPRQVDRRKAPSHVGFHGNREALDTHDSDGVGPRVHGGGC